MFYRKGELVIEGALSRETGFDFSLSRDFTHPDFGWTVPRQFFAIWWARGCDLGLYVQGLLNFHRKVGQWRDEPEFDPGQRHACPGHVWVYTGAAYGGDDESYHGEGRVYCENCGADGDA